MGAEPNAALQWQAMSLGCRSRELVAGCPLEQCVRGVTTRLPIDEMLNLAGYSLEINANTNNRRILHTRRVDHHWLGRRNPGSELLFVASTSSAVKGLPSAPTEKR